MAAVAMSDFYIMASGLHVKGNAIAVVGAV
jgi:hypothetical protein